MRTQAGFLSWHLDDGTLTTSKWFVVMGVGEFGRGMFVPISNSKHLVGI